MTNENKSNANKSNVQQKIVLSAEYGYLHVSPVDLEDHAAMRADQLSAILLMIGGDGEENFAALNENSRQSYLALAWQFATEIKEILPFMTVRSGAAA
ncbi:hypothetical protein [Massilia eurypsychrophila]|nr:hypothetical protein [Massilia eurypsychrophila]